MSTILDEVLAANARYAESFGDKGSLPMLPARKFAILTCMDARLDPAQYAGLTEGDAHVIRNAGGRASDDAIRSLAISYKLLGTREWLVVHHTNCGMDLVSSDVMGDLLGSSPETVSVDPSVPDHHKSVVEAVLRLRSHPLVPKDIPIYGFLFDVATGRLLEVPDAMMAGRAI